MADWIDVREAWRVIESVVEPLATEEVPLEAARGRVVREVVRVDRDLPPFDRSAMDGFAVRAADVAAARGGTPVRLRVAGESSPGAAFAGVLAAGRAARIMTGAPLPEGADAVVPVENTSGFAGETVEIRAAVAAGSHVTRRGRERHAGDTVFTPGRRLTAADVGALAVVGAARVKVGRRARIAVLSTGNELVPHTEIPDPLHIRNSNGPMLASLAASWAAAVEAVGIAGDTPEAIEAAVRRGLDSDLLLVSGGVSMGAYDLVGRSAGRAGVRLHFERVALQPGKPTTFGTHARGAMLALPGNPVSALTTFRLFGTHVLRRLEGESAFLPGWFEMDARFDWDRRHSKWLLLPGRRVTDADRSGAARLRASNAGSGGATRSREEGGRRALDSGGSGSGHPLHPLPTGGGAAWVETVPYAGSGDLLAYARADCQIVLPPERERVREGERVLVWPLGAGSTAG
jgi:molybdopterin molybdotransferase